MKDDEQTGHENERKELTEDIKEYLNLRVQIIRLNITEKVSVALAGMIMGAASFILYLLIVLFLSAALAFWIGSLLENLSLGFAITGGFYLVIVIVVGMIMKKKFKQGLTNKFIEDFSNDD